MADTFIPLGGWGVLDAGPVLGALVNRDGGPLLYIDLQVGRVRPVLEGQKLEQIQATRPEPAAAPVQYALMSTRTGQVGRGRFDSVVEAAVYANVSMREGVQLVALEGDEPRALYPDERDLLLKYNLRVGVQDE